MVSPPLHKVSLSQLQLINLGGKMCDMFFDGEQKGENYKASYTGNIRGGSSAEILHVLMMCDESTSAKTPFAMERSETP